MPLERLKKLLMDAARPTDPTRPYPGDIYLPRRMGGARDPRLPPLGDAAAGIRELEQGVKSKMRDIEELLGGRFGGKKKGGR